MVLIATAEPPLTVQFATLNVAPAPTAWEPPLNARVPEPLTAPPRVEPAPESVRVFAPSARVEAEFSVRAPA